MFECSFAGITYIFSKIDSRNEILINETKLALIGYENIYKNLHGQVLDLMFLSKEENAKPSNSVSSKLRLLFGLGYILSAIFLLLSLGKVLPYLCKLLCNH